MAERQKKNWEKSAELRQSMPDIMNPEYKKEFENKEEKPPSFIDKINNKLLSYKEIKYFCKKTRIKPFYYCILLTLALCFILIGYFDKYLSIILATLYPLFMTFKTLNNFDEDDEDVKVELIHWLKYWIFYCLFINFESLFGNFFRTVYFLYKIIVLLCCFPINSSLINFVYTKCLGIVSTNETHIVKFCKNIVDHVFDKDSKKTRGNRRKNEKGETEEFKGSLQDKIEKGKAALDILKNIY